MPLPPRLFLIIGFLLVVLGAILPFLMVLRIIEPSFLVSFISFVSSAVGLFFGIIGSALYIRKRR